MLKQAPADPVLIHFRAAIDETYGDRLERVVLFGSRARGRSQPDSDYDVAVFLRDLRDRETEMNRLADIATEILYNDGEFVHAMAYHAGSYDEQTALMQEIRAEGYRPVKPQSSAFLEKSRQFLAKAQELLDAHRWPDEAGRAAYLAGFHAAQAFIFESTGKAARWHGGVQRQFACW